MLRRWRRRSQTKEYRQPLEAEKDKEMNSPPGTSIEPCPHADFSSVKLISDLRPPERHQVCGNLLGQPQKLMNCVSLRIHF